MSETDLQVTANEAKPELLYHYTDQKGLIGILQSRNIWASHIRYLNDSSEGKLFIKRFSELLKEAGTEKKTVKIMENLVDQQHVFIASFSELGDSLSQWRAYSGGGGGYSIGFSRDFLCKVNTDFLSIHAKHFYKINTPFGRCIYGVSGRGGSPNREKKEYSVQIDQKVNQTNPAAESRSNKASYVREDPIAVILFALWLASLTKHKGFAEEKEWRLTLVQKENTLPCLTEFRPGISMPVPYIKIPLHSVNRPPEIRRVVIGPCPHPKEAMESVKRLLEKHGIKGAQVVSSEIPFRDW